ncbi:hypothetical protein FB45DRAFT_1007569 [Roridomyces roridus]|uniref:Uncharacterized protein n=1 Tax=Roridomyces roridus TaxID=1738132 RepID=A0AAD7BDR8_9AGAR|nr:hypothetical protein FB45DRAFT_1007569 [Roridomyces roridus]
MWIQFGYTDHPLAREPNSPRRSLGSIPSLAFAVHVRNAIFLPPPLISAQLQSFEPRQGIWIIHGKYNSDSAEHCHPADEPQQSEAPPKGAGECAQTGCEEALAEEMSIMLKGLRASTSAVIDVGKAGVTEASLSNYETPARMQWLDTRRWSGRVRRICLLGAEHDSNQNGSSASAIITIHTHRTDPLSNVGHTRSSKPDLSYLHDNAESIQ